MKKTYDRKTRLFAGLSSVSGLLCALSVALTSTAFYYSGYVNDFLGIRADDVGSGSQESLVYRGRFGEWSAENSDKLIEAEKAHGIQTMEEGAVLVRNEKGTLPLKSEERRITLFGNSVKAPVYATNAGQASFNADRGGDLHTAFADAGFAINETMYNAYLNSGVSRVTAKERGKSDIGEVGMDFYTSELKNSFANDYNDVAVVLLTRYAGEGVDLEAVSDVDGVPSLSFHQEEKDLLKMIKNSGKFKKVVVLVNSPFAMDLQWIEEEEYGVDACVAFGAAGDVGFIGIANLLKGEADFSGHFADTWATNSLSSPAMQNFGDFQYANHNTKYESDYVVYAEGIYVGYKYYETRYHDQVMGVNNATSSAGVFASKGGWNYADEMAYPFGYGLSYADFSQEVQSIVWDRENHALKAEVKVTNEGGYENGKSKSVVQLYASLPYKEGGAEKSAVQLVGFGKTGLLGKGESEVVTVEVSDYLFATYDEACPNGADSSKNGCYVFDEGEYFFAIGDSAHDALNNVLAFKGVSGMTDEKGNIVEGDKEKAIRETLKERDNLTYAKSTTGEVVSNRLDLVNLNHYIDGAVEYLTRADWNTFPKTYTGLSATEEMKKLLEGNTYKADPAVSADSIVTSEDRGIKFIEMKDYEFDDPKWDEFICQLTTKELATIVGDNRGNIAIPSVGKPANASTNGPNGIQGSYNKGNKKGCTLYPDEIVLSCTFNLELCKERGAFFGEDAQYAGVTMVFGPGANLHRTFYLGRCSEYYSEDGVLSYDMAKVQATEMSKFGIITGFKHFALNDQETNRHGVSTFATEQACREIYLKPFEGGLSEGAGLGVMTSYNRIGMVASPACAPLQIGILRDEWGFQGINITDSSKDASDYVHTKECMTGGTDLFLSDTGRTNDLVTLVKQGKDGTILQFMQTANKHFYYAHSRSVLVNGLTVDTVVKETVYWWQPALIAVCSAFGVLTAGCLVLFVLNAYVFGKEEK